MIFFLNKKCKQICRRQFSNQRLVVDWVCFPEFIISAQKVALQMPSVCISITSRYGMCCQRPFCQNVYFYNVGEVAYILMAFGYIQIWHHSLPTYIKRTTIVLQTTPCPSQSKSVQCSMKLQSIQCCHRVANLILILQELVQKPHTLVINNSLLVTTPNIYSVWCTNFSPPDISPLDFSLI